MILGRELLLPDPQQFHSDEDLLRAAVELSGDTDVGRRRQAYWRWQREFLGDGLFTAATDVQAAVEEMADLIADEQRALRRSKLRLVTLFALTAATAGAGLLAGPLAPAAVAGAFLSVGQFVAGEAFQQPRVPGPGSLLLSARRELGWHED